MPRITVARENELRQVIRLDHEVIAAMEHAFQALAGGAVVMPPILRLDIPAHHGEVDVKTAYMPGVDGFAIKISPGFFDNPKLGLPSVNGLMTLFSAETGLLQALYLDNGYLTDIRTAAAGAVAAKHLARADATVAAILGAGVQARLQLAALMLVRPLRRVRLWARDPGKAAQTARDLARAHGIEVTAVEAPETAVREADIVVTTTPSTTPILRAAWLQPGQHITAMGSDAEHKNELEPAVIAHAARYVADSLNQTERLGELHHARRAGMMADGAPPLVELGAVIAGHAVGRRSPDERTVCDLTGTGVQDTAIAVLARARLATAGIGTLFDS